MNYLVDGYFLTERTNGVQRFGYEILKRWDTYEESKGLQILVPDYYDDSKQFSNLRIIKYGSKKRKIWEQVDFSRYARKHQLEGIFFTNTVPVNYRKGIVVLHDVIFKARPDLFNTSLRGKITVFWRTLLYSLVVKSNMRIVTVSEYSKAEIERLYGVTSNRITVVYNSWQHMDNIGFDNTIFERANIEEKQYFFSMATVAKNKNFEWILSCARDNPSQQFVVAGGGNLDKVRKELGYDKLNNVIFLGYVSDEEAKSLMKNCKAFLFPTLYEGFGIPPLEAVACGAKSIIVSDTTCMHEIYKDYATYLDPLNYSNISIRYEANEHVTDVLKLYDWDKSAEKFFSLLKN